MSREVDIKELFIAGAHFGHKTSRWHPKMAPFIHSEKGGIHIIDLEKTVESLAPAMEAIKNNASKDRQILLVGTKQQAEVPIQEASKIHGQPYVTGRWMGGLLTNFKTISRSIKGLKELEQRMESGELKQRYSKLEVQRYQEEIDALNEQFGGIKEMPGIPGLVFIVDINKDDLAVKEARKLKIPVVAIVDSNCDPSKVEYPIPANDDAIKTIELVLGLLNEAISEAKGSVKPAPKAEVAEVKAAAVTEVAEVAAEPVKAKTPTKPDKKPAKPAKPAKKPAKSAKTPSKPAKSVTKPTKPAKKAAKKEVK